MADRPKPGARQREHTHYLAEVLRTLERDLHGRIAEAGLIPPEWQAIALERGARPKVRLCLWVEADVLGFYRSQGAGHTRRMAEVLRSFMHARLAGILRGPEHTDYSAPEPSPITQKLNALRARMAARDAKEGLGPDLPLTFEERLAALKAEQKTRMEQRKREAARRKGAGDAARGSGSSEP